jgi:hypothetical protein
VRDRDKSDKIHGPSSDPVGEEGREREERAMEFTSERERILLRCLYAAGHVRGRVSAPAWAGMAWRRGTRPQQSGGGRVRARDARYSRTCDVR